MKQTTTLGLILIASITLTATSNAFANEVYSWKDSGGKMHYSDTPPTDVEAKKVRSSSSATPVTSTVEPAPKKSAAEIDLEFKKRKADADAETTKAEKERNDLAEKKRNCDQATAQLKALESGQRISNFDSKGEKVVLDDEGRAKETKAAQKSVQDWCGK